VIVIRIMVVMSILEIPGIYYLPMLRHFRKIPKTVLTTRLKTQETTYALVYVNICVS
jgi:hypothetical protein